MTFLLKIPLPGNLWARHPWSDPPDLWFNLIGSVRSGENRIKSHDAIPPTFLGGKESLVRLIDQLQRRPRSNRRR